MSSNRFVLVESASAGIPGLLLAAVKGFSGSDEYARLDGGDRQSAGLVCGALAIYVNRKWLDGDSELIIRSAFEAIESLSAVSDLEVQNLVVTELLGSIDFSDQPELTTRMGPRSRALYDRWVRGR